MNWALGEDSNFWIVPRASPFVRARYFSRMWFTYFKEWPVMVAISCGVQPAPVRAPSPILCQPLLAGGSSGDGKSRYSPRLRTK
jgi:hypothetical protein